MAEIVILVISSTLNTVDSNKVKIHIGVLHMRKNKTLSLGSYLKKMNGRSKTGSIPLRG